MRILVMRPGALGDVMLTLPSLQALKAAYPQSEIHVMGNLAVLTWLPGRSVVTAVSSFDRVDLAALFQPMAVPGESLQGYLDQFDLILSYVAPPGHIFACNLARVAQGRVVGFDARPTAHLRIHMSEYLQRPLCELDVPIRSEPPHVRLTPEDQQQAAHWWREHNLGQAPAVAIHPGSGSETKNWPAACFTAVAQYLRAKNDTHILLLAGPADDHALAEIQQLLDKDDYILVHKLPLKLLPAILARCQAYLGNDSGVSHLAAAIGVPTVAIFGPMDPAVWAPRGPRVSVVQTRAACAPCNVERRSSCQQQVCLEAISPDVVVAALQSAVLTAETARDRGSSGNRGDGWQIQNRLPSFRRLNFGSL